jgi:hypothetical protein
MRPQPPSLAGRVRGVSRKAYLGVVVVRHGEGCRKVRMGRRKDLRQLRRQKSPKERMWLMLNRIESLLKNKIEDKVQFLPELWA